METSDSTTPRDFEGAPALEHASERQEALRRYHILDTAPERNFDQITRLVAQVCDVPTALITLLDTERQWFKSCFGYDRRETDIEVSFCAHAVHQEDTLVVEDATQDERFSANPLVTDEGWRFYAGAPLRTPDGVMIGTLCIVDYEPRVFDAAQRALLEDLAELVIGQFELRSAEAQYRKLFEGHPQPALIYDADTLDLLDANAAAARTYGYASEEELRGRPLADLVAPASLEDHADRTLEGTAPFTARHVRSDGTPMSVEVREESIRYDGQQARMAVMIDATDRTRGRQYERLVENMQEIVFETDLEGEATFLSSAWEELTGFSAEETVGESLLHYVHPKDRVESLQAFAPLLQRRQNLLRHRARVLTEDGREVPMQFRARLITGEDGTPIGTVGTLTPLDESELPAPEARAGREEKKGEEETPAEAEAGPKKKSRRRRRRRPKSTRTPVGTKTPALLPPRPPPPTKKSPRRKALREQRFRARRKRPPRTTRLARTSRKPFPKSPRKKPRSLLTPTRPKRSAHAATPRRPSRTLLPKRVRPTRKRNYSKPSRSLTRRTSRPSKSTRLRASGGTRPLRPPPPRRSRRKKPCRPPRPRPSRRPRRCASSSTSAGRRAR
jgi:PAS domain S-box-containing protein